MTYFIFVNIKVIKSKNDEDAKGDSLEDYSELKISNEIIEAKEGESYELLCTLNKKVKNCVIITPYYGFYEIKRNSR